MWDPRCQRMQAANRNCHRAENSLQYMPAILALSLPANRGARPVQAIIKRVFGVIDEYFDHEWVVIWPLDDL